MYSKSLTDIPLILTFLKNELRQQVRSENLAIKIYLKVSDGAHAMTESARNSHCNIFWKIYIAAL